MEIEKIEKLINEIDLVNHKSHKCSHSNCDNRPINSHTISRGNFKNLGDFENLIMIESSVMTAMKKKHVMKKFNSEMFSIFVGFCEKHDYELFPSIDSYDGAMNQQKAADSL